MADGSRKSPLRVIIITQEDAFSIPRNIERVITLPGIEVSRVFVLNIKGSVANRKAYFAKGFGLLQSAKMAILLAGARIADLADGLVGNQWLKEKRSIRAVCQRWGICYAIVDGVNNVDFHNRLRSIRPDVVVSFSAPCVFQPELLSIPTHGSINLHCSILPQYAGLLPSFWVLFHEEQTAGATVHYMDDRIDNGAILSQTSFALDQGISMFRLIERTKSEGGRLMCEVLLKIRDGKEIQVHENRVENGSYFTWPTIQQFQEFRNRGGRLV